MTPADDQPEFILYDAGEELPFVFATPEEEAAFRAAVQEGKDDVDAGRTISGEAMFAWLRSWFTENELPPPRCGD